jgi:hypothetical protein
MHALPVGLCVRITESQCTGKKWRRMGCQSTSAIGFVLNIWLRFAKNGERLESPHLDRNFRPYALNYFGVLRRRRLRRRTPGPPPFSSMNSMPPKARARRRAERASSDTLGPPSVSTLFTVGRDIPACLANSVCDQPSSARAARSCSGVIVKLALDPFWLICYDPFWIMFRAM